MKKYRKINISTITNEDKKTIVVLTKFDNESIRAFKYAVNVFGENSRYILLSIYSFGNSLESNSVIPDEIRLDILAKLTKELGAIRVLLGNLQPEIAIQFEFGRIKDISENGWNKGEFDLVVIPKWRQSRFGRVDVMPDRIVPVLYLPKLK